jgi:alkaline phosphatase D
MKKLLHSSIVVWILPLLVFAIASCQHTSPLISNPYGSAPQTPKKRDALGLVPRGLDLSNAPKKIAFGSCSDQNQPQPIWQQILNEKPDLMIMMGNNIYATKEETKNQIEQYKKWAQVPDYKKARETIPFMATWDDQDYGVEEGGADNVTKEDARKAFWFHWPYVKDSTLLDQPGIFHSKVMGGTKEGRGRRAHVTQSVHVIMLDTRWNRSPLKLAEVKTVTDAVQTPETPPPVQKKFAPNEEPKATILGPEQWDWLEDQLREPADFKILVSSIQVIANDHDNEKWGNFPKERQKLFDLIAKVKPKNLIILSGNRYLASIAKTEIKGWGTLYDVTSSSLNKPKDLTEKDPTYLFDAYGKENFGLMTIDWSKRSALVEIKDLSDKTIQQVDLKLKR